MWYVRWATASRWHGVFGRAAEGGAAAFFVAHADTHAEATQDNPITVSGAQPVSFEVRMRDAGTAEKAGWQTSLLIDACEFETPAVSAIVLGDMFGIGIPVRQVLPVENDVFKIKLGQVMFPGSTKSAAGLSGHRDTDAEAAACLPLRRHRRPPPGRFPLPKPREPSGPLRAASSCRSGRIPVS